MELNYLLCFLTSEPAGARDGAALRTNGLAGDHALQKQKILGAQQSPCSSSRVLEVTRFCHKLSSAGVGACGFWRSSCWAPWRPHRWLVLRWGGQTGAPPPGLTAWSLHGKLLRANVAGPMESARLPSAEILGCVSHAHRHGSFESLVCARPLHITVFFQQFLYFGVEGGEKVWRSGSKGMGQDPVHALRCP